MYRKGKAFESQTYPHTFSPKLAWDKETTMLCLDNCTGQNDVGRLRKTHSKKEQGVFSHAHTGRNSVHKGSSRVVLLSDPLWWFPCSGRTDMPRERYRSYVALLAGCKNNSDTYCVTVSPLPGKHTTHTHHRHKPRQMPKPRQTYTFISLPPPQTEPLRDLKAQSSPLFLRLLLSFPLLPPCLCVPSLTWKEGAGGLKRCGGDQWKTNKTLHIIYLPLRICEMNLSQHRMWSENSCKSFPGEKDREAKVNGEEVGVSRTDTVSKREFPIDAFLSGLPVYALETQISHPTLPEGYAILYMNSPASLWDTGLLTLDWHTCVW